MPQRRRTDRNRPAATRGTRQATAVPPTHGVPKAPRLAFAWPWVIPLALLALAFACRGAPLGTAVADDYSFLARLAFQKPLDGFDSMGATYYWRPLSRQFYFTLVGPWLLEAPWVAVALHALLIGVTSLLAFRIARRELGAPVAAAVAAGIALSEPARVLLAWPSGSQHLLAAMFALLAIHEAQARRLPTALIAALAGLLSHESAALSLPVILLIVWRGRRDPRALGVAAAGLIGVAALWAIGYRTAIGHGVALPPAHPATEAGRTAFTLLGDLYGRAIPAALNIEDVHGPERLLIVFMLIGCAIAAGVLYARPAGRARLRAAGPVALTAAAWFCAGVMPLVMLLPDWNGWRSWTPSLGIAFALPALFGGASPWLAGIYVSLRLIALLIAPGAPAFVTREPLHLGSHVSFPQLVRLQRIVVASREAILKGLPALQPHDRVCYWSMPRLAEFGFQGSRALQVWYADSTLRWAPFGGQQGLTTPLAGGIEYSYDRSPFAAVVTHASIALYQQSAALSSARQFDRADSALRASLAALGRDRGPFASTLVQNLARNAYHRGQFERADSLNTVSLRLDGETAFYWLLRATCAGVQGDTTQARAAIQRSLALEPTNAEALGVARQLGVVR